MTDQELLARITINSKVLVGKRGTLVESTEFCQRCTASDTPRHERRILHRNALGDAPQPIERFESTRPVTVQQLDASSGFGQQHRRRKAEVGQAGRSHRRSEADDIGALFPALAQRSARPPGWMPSAAVSST